jgi:hypothetical protein
VVDASNHVRIGDTSVTQIGGQVAWSRLSDARHKENIRDLDLGLDFVMQLRPVSFTMKQGNGRTDMGFLAQDVEAVLGDDYNVLGIGATATVVAILLLLIWLNTSRGLVKPAGSSAGNTWGHLTSGAILDVAERPMFWKFAIAKIREKPWTGYGTSLTPSLYAELHRESEHAHNLEFEAALYAGIPAALLIVLFSVSSLKAAARAFLARRPLALPVAALLFFFFLLAQVEPLIFGSPYPSLPIVLIPAVHLGLPRGAEVRPH